MAEKRPSGVQFSTADMALAGLAGPGSSARTGQGDRIVQGVSALTYFGPLQPIEPAVRPQDAETLGVLGRQYDYPVGYNLRIIPRQEELVGFDQLRALADSLDVLRLVIETRKDQLAKLEWRFNAKEGQSVPDDKLAKISDFWRSPDKQNNWDEWLRALLEDSYVIDAATIYPRPTKKGERAGTAKGYTYCFELLDGATIKPLIDGRGRLPRAPSIAYQQIIKGMPAVEYTTDELVYRPRNVRTHKVYGFPEVEQIVMTVNIALRREMHKLQFYSEGNIPEALISVPKEWSTDQIASYQAYWDSVCEGNTAERRHAKFVPEGTKYIPTKEGALKGDFDEWLIRVICYALSVSPAPFVKMMNRATAQSQQTAATEEGLVPRMKWIANLVNHLTWNYLGEPDVVFRWEEEESVDPLIQAQTFEIYIDKGVQTAKQVAEKLGLDWEEPEEEPEPGKIAETIQAGDPSASPGSAPASSAKPAPTEVLPPGAKEPATAKPVAVAKLAKGEDRFLAKSAAARPPKKYREIARVPRDGAAIEKAQKSIANRLTSLFKKQRKDFLAQAEKAVGGAAPAAEKMQKADYTDDQIRKIIEQIEIEGWAFVPEELAPFLQKIFAETGSQVLKNLGITSEAKISAVDDAALEYARATAAELVGMKWVDGELVDNPNAAFSIAETTRDQINSIITNAFSGEDETAGWKDVAARIEALSNGSDVFSASRAETIARTEIGNAQMAGAAAGYEEGKALGLELEKQWLADVDIDDECSQNADEGWVAYDDMFPSGDMMPLAHPNCRCDLAVRVVEQASAGGEDVGEEPFK